MKLKKNNKVTNRPYYVVFQGDGIIPKPRKFDTQQEAEEFADNLPGGKLVRLVEVTDGSAFVIKLWRK